MNQTELDAAIERANRIFSCRSTPSRDKSRAPERSPAQPDEHESSLVSLDAEFRFGHPHSRLFPLIGHKVRTPSGLGTLIQVYSDKVTVLLDSDRKGACVRFLPSEVSPVAT